MSHLTIARWHGYATEPRAVTITVASDLVASQIASGTLSIADQPDVALTPGTHADGYTLSADIVLPAAGFYKWTAEVEDDDGNAPIVVAMGQLRVTENVTGGDAPAADAEFVVSVNGESGVVTLTATDVGADPTGTAAAEVAASEAAAAIAAERAAFLSHLEAMGAGVDQDMARTEQERWLDLIRAVGAGTPPDPTVIYSGGDVTSAFFDGVNITWTLADYFPNVDVGADDTYDSGILGPLRNGVIIQTGANFVGQLGGGGVWLDAVADGGEPEGLWWPLTQAPHSNAVFGYVLCWYNDAAITAENPYGEYIDTHIVTTVFGAYNSHVALGATDKKFFAESARLSGSTVYVLGGEFHPDIDGLAVGEVGYAGTADLDVLRAQPDISHRLARAPQATFEVVAAWEYWTGSTWSTNRALAVELTDTDGNVIHGAAGFYEVKSGHWVMAAHHMVDTHVDVYSFDGAAPTGPWTHISRVPIVSPVGREVDGGVQIAWHTKVLGFMDAPAEHSIVMMTAWPQGLTTAFLDTNIRRMAPIFAVVPWH